MKTNIIINKDIINVYATSIINLIQSGEKSLRAGVDIKIVDTLRYIKDNNEGGEGFQRLVSRAIYCVNAYCFKPKGTITMTETVEALANIVVAKYEA